VYFRKSYELKATTDPVKEYFEFEMEDSKQFTLEKIVSPLLKHGAKYIETTDYNEFTTSDRARYYEIEV
jgi:hypothetical protein